MSSIDGSDTSPRADSRRLGNVQLVTACGIVLFWGFFFAVENRRADADGVYLAFERSFPVPDLGWLVPLLVAGGLLMRRARRGAIPCAIAAGGAMVFLGLLDVSFNVQQARYTVGVFDGVLNGLINLYCIIVGVLLIVWTWRNVRDGFGAGSGPHSDATQPGVKPTSDAEPTAPPDRPTARSRGRASNLSGRHVAITGGSSGIGLAAAKKLAAAGAHVIILARDQRRLDAAAAEINAVKHSSALPCLALRCDVADADQVAEAFETMARAERTPEILINSAGISEPGYFEQQPLETFDRQMRINYLGTVTTTRQALPGMIERGGGHVVNISSVAGLLGVFGYAGYAATKFAVWGFSEALRAELRRYNVAVSVVCPPDTDTPQLRKENEVKPAETKAISGTVKVMSAEKVADAIIAGIVRRRFIVVVGLESKLVRAVLGLSRSLVYWILDRKADKVTRGVHAHA